MNKLLIAYILVACIGSLHYYFQSGKTPRIFAVYAIFIVFLLLSTLQSSVFLFFIPHKTEFQRALPLGLLYGPFLFFAVNAVDEKFTIRWKNVSRHVLPFFLWLPFYVCFVIYPEFRSAYAIEYHIVLYFLVFLSCFIYSTGSYIKLSRLKEVSQISMLILSSSIILLLVYSIYVLMLIYIVHIGEGTLVNDTVIKFVLLLRVLVVSFILYNMLQLFLSKHKTPTVAGRYPEEGEPRLYKIDNAKYKDAQLPLVILKEYIQKFETLLIDQKYFLSPDVGLNQIATLLRVPPAYITQLVNRSYHTNLQELINHLRIEYACELMIENQTLSISEVSVKAGFSSESTFFRNFKTFKSMTASEYREIYS